MNLATLDKFLDNMIVFVNVLHPSSYKRCIVGFIHAVAGEGVKETDFFLHRVQ